MCQRVALRLWRSARLMISSDRNAGWESKHLKGQLDPPVGNCHVFGSKVVSWISLLVMSRFWIKGGQLDPPVGNVTFFGSKEVSWISLLVSMVFQCSFRVFHGFWLVSMVFQGSFMVFMVFHGSRLVFHGFFIVYCLHRL